MHEFKILEREDMRVVSSPFRQELLEALSTRSSAVKLARHYDMSRQRIGYHMRALERAGLIEEVGERPVRGLTEKLYRARPMAWVLSPGERGPSKRLRDRFSWATLTNLAARTLWDLVSLRRKADAVGKRLATLALDAELHFETPAERNAFTGELLDVVERLVRKHERPQSGTSRAFRLVLGAYPKTDEEGVHDRQSTKH
jgi:DNA-binding transcriptional ArsR family regulator